MLKLQATLGKSVIKSSKFEWFTYMYFPIIFILVLRNGINFWGYDKYALQWVKKWPRPVSVFSVENSGDLFLAKLFGVDTRFSWIVLHIALTIIFFIVLCWLINIEKIPNYKKRNILFLVLVSPITMLLMQEIGYYDVVTLIGAVIFAFRNDLKIKLLGTLILCAGNTPQALIMTLLFGFFLHFINSTSKKFDLRNFTPFIFASSIWVLEKFWLNSLGRVLEYNYGQWSYSFKGFLIASPLFLYALLGPMWLISFNVLESLQKYNISDKIGIFFCLLIIPGLFGVFTGDSTRDSLCIMSPILLWLIRYVIIEHDLVIGHNLKIMMCLAPCFLVWREGQIIPPWQELTKLFFP